MSKFIRNDIHENNIHTYTHSYTHAYKVLFISTRDEKYSILLYLEIRNIIMPMLLRFVKYAEIRAPTYWMHTIVRYNVRVQYRIRRFGCIFWCISHLWFMLYFIQIVSLCLQASCLQSLKKKLIQKSCQKKIRKLPSHTWHDAYTCVAMMQSTRRYTHSHTHSIHCKFLESLCVPHTCSTII